MSEIKQNTIGKEFTLSELCAFVAPPVLTRLVASLLTTLDDSLFVSRFLGQNALAAFSLAYPWFMFIEAIGMMVSSISVICSIKMGEKKNEEAKSDFTTTVILASCIGLFLTLILCLFLEPILLILGETELLLPYAQTFFNVSKYYQPLILMNFVFNAFYVIAGKPKWSMYVSIANILCQFFFDWLFIVKLQVGIVGAAYANMIGHLVVTLIAIIFYSNQNREMCFFKPHSRLKELLSNIYKYGRMAALTSMAVSINTYVYNRVHLYLGGEMVVAAYTIVVNVTFIFLNSFFGLVGSTSPIASYAYGEKNAKKLSRIFRQTLILITGLILFIMAIIYFGRDIFVQLYLANSDNHELIQMVYRGFMIYPLSLITFGYNVYAQDLFNVLGNHKVSIFLSIIENIVVANIAVVAIPLIFGVENVWFCFPVAEAVTFIFTLYFLYRYRNVYGFGKDGIATAFNK